MDGTVLVLRSTFLQFFVGGIVTGLAGFALGVVVSGVWDRARFRGSFDYIQQIMS